jgi:hypothetical protein
VVNRQVTRRGRISKGSRHFISNETLDPSPVSQQSLFAPQWKNLYISSLPFLFFQRHKQSQTNNLQNKSQKTPAKSHVKPKKRITPYPSITSTLRGSFTQSHIIELETKKGSEKSGPSPFNP